MVADNKYYFTPLNILKEGLNTEYLNDIPIEILRRILADNKLDDFYKHMEDYIFQNKPYTNYYSKDTIFTNTTSFQKGEIDLPFGRVLERLECQMKT